MLRELIATELESRIARCEYPSLVEYLGRFPDDKAVVEAAFARVKIAPPPRTSAASAGRNLLFGLLALQTNFINREALLAAFNSWITDKNRSLAQILIERGDLDAARRDLINALVVEHLKQHGGDSERSLAAMAVGSSTRDALKAAGDADLEATLSRVGKAEPASEVEVASSLAGAASAEASRRYRVLRFHKKGGLGEVSVALDAELNREVAFKEIRNEFADEPSFRHRFLLEAEITGGLEHPGIVPVYGLGTYDGGRLYYAMRFIKGDSLKEAIEKFHDDARLKADPGERAFQRTKLLRRFLDVCNAIHYAHSRGILHRDIKPGNVIVGEYGETVVLDWGLAKPAGKREPSVAGEEHTLKPKSAEGSAETVQGSAVGSPGYMSPEQAAGDLARLGFATDVYGLGATLYTILTGRAPATGPNVEAVLKDVKAGNIPAPRSLDPSLDPALEAVCMKALSKEPNDRYPTAKALAEDLERWLGDNPVTVYSEPFSRRAARWARRNRTTVSAAAAALIVGFVALSALFAVQSKANKDLREANSRKDDALKAETLANNKKDKALKAETRAKKETEIALAKSEESRKRAETVLTFFKDDVLAAARPENQEGGLGVGVTVRKAVEAAESKIAERFKDQPLVEADIRNTLGMTYFYLREASLMIPQLERASELRESRLGLNAPDTLDSLGNLVLAYGIGGRPADSIKLAERILRPIEATFGPEHSNTLTFRDSLGVVYETAGRIGDAIQMHEETLKLKERILGPDHPSTLTTRNNLGTDYLSANRADDAIRLHKETLRLMEAKKGPNHPDTLTVRNNLAVAYDAAGRHDDAIRMLVEVLNLEQKILGPDHPGTLGTRNNLAEAYGKLGRVDDALRLHKETANLMEAKQGPDHPDTLLCRNNLALAYANAGRVGDAIGEHEETVKRMEAKLGLDHPTTLTGRDNLAMFYNRAGRVQEAIRLREINLKTWESKFGLDHPDSLNCGNQLVQYYYVSGRASEAVALWHRMLPSLRKVFGPGHDNTLIVASNLAGGWESFGRWAEAEELRREVLARRREAKPLDTKMVAFALSNLGVNLLNQLRWPEADPLLREALVVWEMQPDHWRRFWSMSQLGRVLMGQEKYGEAEPFVVQGYEGMEARQTTISAPNRLELGNAAERVVQLYKNWGKLDQAKKWAEKLGLADLPENVFAPEQNR